MKKVTSALVILFALSIIIYAFLFLEKKETDESSALLEESEELVVRDQPTEISETISGSSSGPIIYVSIVTHNEEPNIRQPEYLEDEDYFWKSHAGLVEWGNMLKDEGVMYNFQSDWDFLAAVIEYDGGTEETNGKNVVQWLYEDMGFEIDPHGHESTYNYADIAYLIEQLGVPPSGVVGGFLGWPVEDSKVEYFQETITGWIYDYTWEAEILWGAATAGHHNEEDLWISGIWRPKSNEEFTEHDPDEIPYVGGYASKRDGLEDLIAKYEAGELEEGKIYTVTLMNGQPSLIEIENYIEDFRTEIASYQGYTEQGVIQWVGLAEVVEIWETEYDAEPNQLFYSQ